MRRLATGLLGAALLSGCYTVSTGREGRPWWQTTIDPEGVPLPHFTSPIETGVTGDLEQLDYHDAHGAGWWDAPWVFAEEVALSPTYLLWGFGETTYTELLNGGYSYDHGQWQWWAVNGTLGPVHAVLSSVNYGVVWLVDTAVHDPVAAIWWARRRQPDAIADAAPQPTQAQ